jgi:hypothetical protein
MRRGLPPGDVGARDHNNEVSPGYSGDVLTATAKTGRPPRRKISQYISKRQTANLIEAIEFANVIGFPLNVSLDISWVFFSGSVDDRTRFARCQQRFSKWTSRRGFSLTMVWSREVGKQGGVHTHVLVHVQPWLMDSGDFECALYRAFEPEGGPADERAIKIQRAYDPLRKLLYNLKGSDPRHARQYDITPSRQGDLEGKRAGCTENISGRARKRYQLGK